MAKANEKVLVASGSVAAAVDAGCVVSSMSKRLEVEAEVLKKEIVGAVGSEVNGVSVRVQGTKGSLLVSKAESYTVNTGDVRFEEVKAMVGKGQLADVVTEKVAATIPAGNLDEVKKLLGEVLFNKLVAVKTTYAINPEGYRGLMAASGSPEVDAVKGAIMPLVSKDETFRFTYSPSAVATEEAEVSVKTTMAGGRKLTI